MAARYGFPPAPWLIQPYRKNRNTISSKSSELPPPPSRWWRKANASSTAIAQGLKRFSRLTVITNAVNIAAELAGTDFEVILVGGTLRKNSFSLVGPLAEDNLEEMHADILFLGVDGFDLEVGTTTPNFLESRVNRAMVKAARKVVVVCDSSKFNHRSLSRITPPGAIHYLITDRNLPTSAVDALRAHNIDVTLV
jgi:DeoR family transcriptional regulator of aga operon